MDDQEGFFHFLVGGRPGCKDVYLRSETENGTLVLTDDLSDERTWFHVEDWTAFTPRKMLSFGKGYFFGHTDGAQSTHFGITLHNCKNNILMAEAGTKEFSFNFNPIWNFRQVEDPKIDPETLKNVFNIMAESRCHHKFLSVQENCDYTNLKFVGRDDRTGKQRWYVEEDENEEGVFYVRAGGRKNCLVSYLAIGAEGKLYLSERQGTGVKLSIWKQWLENGGEIYKRLANPQSCSNLFPVDSGLAKNRLTVEKESCEMFFDEFAFEPEVKSQEWTVSYDKKDDVYNEFHISVRGTKC